VSRDHSNQPKSVRPPINTIWNEGGGKPRMSTRNKRLLANATYPFNTIDACHVDTTNAYSFVGCIDASHRARSSRAWQCGPK
jgi:hypothetical protein